MGLQAKYKAEREEEERLALAIGADINVDTDTDTYTPTYVNPLTNIQRLLIRSLLNEDFIYELLGQGEVIVATCLALLSALYPNLNKDDLKEAITDYILSPKEKSTDGSTTSGGGLGLMRLDNDLVNRRSRVNNATLNWRETPHRCYVPTISPAEQIRLAYFWQEDFSAWLKVDYDKWVAMGAPVTHLTPAQEDSIRYKINEVAKLGERRVYLSELSSRLSLRDRSLSYFQWITLTKMHTDVFQDTLAKLGFVRKEWTGSDELYWNDKVVKMPTTVYYEFEYED